MFGFADVPQHQPDMARVLKRYLNATVPSDGQFQCTGIFVDDGHTVHDSTLGVDEATVRTEAELTALERMGIRVFKHETQYPSTVKDYIGRGIHSMPQYVTASGSRIEKYTRAAEELVESSTVDGRVSRRSLAAIVGKYQFLAPLVRSEQNMLVPLYRARDAFVEPFMAEWGVGAVSAVGTGRGSGPHKSSNFREASTAAAAVELLGPSHRGERLLLRTDNATTMSMVNKQGTMAPDLWPVCRRMFDSAALYDLDLAAEHIPGVENWLSDGLSRYVRRKDYSDWQYRRDEFESIAGMMAMPFTLDGGADPVVTNANLPRYRSVVDGFTRSPVDGEHVYSNLDYACVWEYLEHFLTCQRRSPFETADTFVLPVWDTYDWWPLLKGAHVLRVYSKGSELFTSPEWRNLAAGDGTYAFGAERAFRGSTHWPVVVVHFPPLLPGRRDRAAPEGSGTPSSLRARRAVPMLTGDPRAHALTCLISRLLSMRTRSSTDTVHARGIRDISFFLGHFGGTTLPATVEEVLGYAGYAVELREFRLDSSSWVTIYRYGFVLFRRSGRHHRLLFVFCTVGCLRPTGTRYLRVFYRLRHCSGGVSIEFYSPEDVSIPHVVVVRTDGDLRPYIRGRLHRDKNVDARKPRYFYLPEHIPGLGCSPVALLEEYVLRERVPSGGLLFVAPKGASGWYPGPYMGHGRAFVRAYDRAYPGARDGCLYGGGSARKSLGQGLWTYGWASRMISDVGGGWLAEWPPGLAATVQAGLAAAGGGALLQGRVGDHYFYEPYNMAMATELPVGGAANADAANPQWGGDARAASKRAWAFGGAARPHNSAGKHGSI
ncbi:hypothetical protein CYMTET_56020 [Cymbomonas tetramitiformis]|uniref:Uncharacterized protein n=1 Tax=Cymbomonas tetramitiformis TaxID=36881 RepID=A0AAE0BBT0_9CHLO|nr:hypothetical protein CYMTET_56020 [Cymbomonas tetramitiformis]